jgi:hypothetical protein
MHVCRCDERLKIKSEESTRFSYTGFLGGLEIGRRLKDEKITIVIGECVIVKTCMCE